MIIDWLLVVKHKAPCAVIPELPTLPFSPSPLTRRPQDVNYFPNYRGGPPDAPAWLRETIADAVFEHRRKLDGGGAGNGS